MTTLAEQLARVEHALETGGDVAWPADDPDLSLLAVFASVPVTLRWYERNAVAQEVAEASLRDLGAKLRLYGLEATGIDWLAKIVTARVFTLGRLQFERGQRLPNGEPAFGLHIPELGPLDPAACDAALARVTPFFSALGDPPARYVTCTSWLLDDQLAEYLPEDSRIVQFQRRFTRVQPPVPVPDDPSQDTNAGDAAVAKFVFRTTPQRMAEATPNTRLERAVIDHLASGRHWREMSGYLRLDS